MNNASFAIALHLHQPIGNFENVIDRAYRDCYEPLVELISKYPDIKLTLHISGCLIDYFEKKYPQFLNSIKKMCMNKQIELLSGGYYEPILIAIPPRDILPQIKMLSDYIKSRFGQKVKGMWVPERVWAPWLASYIKTAGIRYCILDDTHFLRAGVLKAQLFGYFLTGPKNREIAVFPSDKKLRYIIPFGKPSDVIGYFSEVAKKIKCPLFVYGDDGEKFGEWPGTHKWVFEQGWLKSFFDELRKNSSWLKLVHFSDCLRYRPIGKVEIPEASYEEMMEWTGGSWMNFLSKYPEANQMHKKMFYVSQKLEEAISLHKKNMKLQEARRELYKGQCNCAYWHGVFGGLYLYHLRKAIYAQLIEADKMIDEVIHNGKQKWIEIKKIDFDGDGNDEVIMENKSFALYLDPAEGGILKELDYRVCSTNLINTLSRRKESYHEKIMEIINRNKKDETIHTIHEALKEIDPSIGNRLIYDRYPRYSLRNYFLNKDVTMGSFNNGTFEEIGDFSTVAYKVRQTGTKVVLEHIGKVFQEEIKLSKEIEILSKKDLQILYCIETKNKGKLDAMLGVEFNITMPFLNSERYRYYSEGKVLGSLDKDGKINGATSFSIIDSRKNLSIKMDFSERTKGIWYFPVKTVSQSERAYELNFQCGCILPFWKLDFTKEKSFRFGILLNFLS